LEVGKSNGYSGPILCKIGPGNKLNYFSKGVAMQEELYQIASKTDSRKIAEFLGKDSQLLLPMLELICNSEHAVDELIDVVGTDKEVPIPAYDAMITNSRLGSRIMEILMKGVSTRKYQEILPQMADTVGVSKSQISREFIAASRPNGLNMNTHRLPAVFLGAWTRCSPAAVQKNYGLSAIVDTGRQAERTCRAVRY
jgi:hypothetical protein